MSEQQRCEQYLLFCKATSRAPTDPVPGAEYIIWSSMMWEEYRKEWGSRASSADRPEFHDWIRSKVEGGTA